MTLTRPVDLLPPEGHSGAWDPMLSGRLPGLALAITMGDRLRLVVLDGAGPSHLDRGTVDELKRNCADRLADDLVDELVTGRARWHPWCGSAAIAELGPGGQLHLRIRNAPSAVLGGFSNSVKRYLPATDALTSGGATRSGPIPPSDRRGSRHLLRSSRTTARRCFETDQDNLA